MSIEIDWKEEKTYPDSTLSIPDVENNVAWYALGQRLSRKYKNKKSQMSTALADAYIKYKPKKALRDKIKASFPDIIVHDIKTLQPEVYKMDEVNYAEEHIVTFSDNNNVFNRMRINASFLVFQDSDEDDDLTYDEGFAERARIINLFHDLLPEQYTKGLKIDYETLSADSEWNWMFYLVALVYIGTLKEGEDVTKKTFFDEYIKKNVENRRSIKDEININTFSNISNPIAFKKNKKEQPSGFYRTLLAYKPYEDQMEVEGAPALPGISTFALLLVVPKSKQDILVIIKDDSKQETVNIKEVVKRPVVA